MRRALWVLFLAAIGAAGWLWWRGKNQASAPTIVTGNPPSTFRDLVDASAPKPADGPAVSAQPGPEPRPSTEAAAKKAAKKASAKKSTKKTTKKSTVKAAKKTSTKKSTAKKTAKKTSARASDEQGSKPDAQSGESEQPGSPPA